MAIKFIRLIPKIPVFKRDMYHIPENYSKSYEQKRITDSDEQKAFFYLTQFGGFRFRKLPSYFKDKPQFLEKWFKSKREYGFSQFKANTNFIKEFGNIELEPLLKKRCSEACYEDKFLLENGFSLKEAKEIEAF
ncbi:MAG: hypothetical protein WC755_05245 [Candidatus Woesearchaeota archaeon]|jgi:hypothetical protein